MCRLSLDYRFASLGQTQAVWTISSIHGELDRLSALHDALAERMAPGDRIVYFGNYTGYSIESAETIDEILSFRRRVLAMPGMTADDIVYLRGVQEDMWGRLLQLQFYANPLDLYLWMLGQGLAHTLQAYGIDPHEGILAARGGVVALTRWTNDLRQHLKEFPGHDMFISQQRRAAYNMLPDGRYPLLFVNAGIDPARPLSKQEDAFYWAGETFTQMTAAYAPFEKVVRGYDPNHGGIHINCVTATLDGGCGFGGPLLGAGLTPDGDVFELLEA